MMLLTAAGQVSLSCMHLRQATQLRAKPDDEAYNGCLSYASV